MATKELTERETNELVIVTGNWDRYLYKRDRGHSDYILQAKLCEDMYLGGGLQWREKDKKYLESIGRPTIEDNLIFPAVNTALGLQLQSRVDIAFKPRGGQADEYKADTLSKVTMQVADDIKYQYKESQMFADGMIMQRGFLDFRMEFDENMKGDIVCNEVDPMDVLPDPDAQSYDPDGWADVTVLRWLTCDHIEELYGKEKADKVRDIIDTQTGSYESDEDYELRSRFGKDLDMYNGYNLEDHVKRVLIVDRQHWRYEMQDVVMLPSGDILLADILTTEQTKLVVSQGGCCSKRMMKRIRWTVTTSDILLHDEWSPYKTFTVIPYFPYFRRGRTRGMVDNAISPQELHNKSESQLLHILNTTANSGWMVEEGSLSNMETSEMGEHGAKSGIVAEYKKGSTKPEKIRPNELPRGLDTLVNRTADSVKSVTGMGDAQQGQGSQERSGVAIQSKQYGGQIQQASPLDNLARTRNLVANKKLELIQGWYTEERIIMITGEDGAQIGEQYKPLTINQQTPEGEILNDLTVGEYDVVVTDMPTQATFDDNQFKQAMEMRERGIVIPDASVVLMSSLTKKHDIAKNMTEAGEVQPDPLDEAKVDEIVSKAELNRSKVAHGKIQMDLTREQAIKTHQEGVNVAIDALYSSLQSAGLIAQTPTIAPMADKIAKSAGYEDQDAPPIIPEFVGGVGGLAESAVPVQDDTGTLDEQTAMDLPPNYSPDTPVPAPQPAPVEVGLDVVNPESSNLGANEGIETQELG